jgi:hypothetical protein
VPESDGSTTETDDDLDDIEIPLETDADRLRLIKTAADDDGTSLRTRSHLTDFWTGKGKAPAKKGKAGPALIVVSDDDETETEDEDEAFETLKKLGLSVQEETDKPPSDNRVLETPGPSKRTPLELEQGRDQTESIEGQWTCTACTL